MLASAASALSLPILLDVAALPDLAGRLDTALDLGDVRLDGAGVERVAANGVLLLLAAGQAAQARSRALVLSQPSPALCEAAQRLGLERHLALICEEHPSCAF